MTKEEFLAKYGGVEVLFYSYATFTFIFRAYLNDDRWLLVECGGSSSAAYRVQATADKKVKVRDLNFYLGRVVDGDMKTIESFVGE